MEKMKEKYRELKNSSKAFTLIELIVVIAVLGILVLMAAPKFLGYTQDAKITQMKSDIKTYESEVTAELASGHDEIEGWVLMPADELQEANSSNRIFDKKGNIVNNLGGKVYLLPDDEIKTQLKGDFIYSEKEGKVLYYGDDVPVKSVRGNSGNGGSSVGEGNNQVAEQVELEPTAEDQFIFKVGGSSGTYMVNGQQGYFQYTGTDETVVIPESINGVKLTSYYEMFGNENTNVHKIVSHNKDVINLTSMFGWSQTTGTLDLSDFDTSNVTSFYAMFSSSKYTDLILGDKFVTNKARDLSRMFQNTKFAKIDISKFETPVMDSSLSYMFGQTEATEITFGPGFDTSKVRYMDNMFSSSKVKSLDLSMFDTTKLTNTGNMFSNSHGVTNVDLSNFPVDVLKSHANTMYSFSDVKTIQVSTQADADNLMTASGKPTNIQFVPKN